MSEDRYQQLLTKFLVDEVYKALGLNPSGWYHRIMDPLIRLPASRFSRIAVEFDADVEKYGFSDAARRVLPKFVRGVNYCGLESVPRSGPLLILSNHPGTVDGLCVAAGLPRNDIRIIASGMPFLRGLSAAARYLIYTSLDTHTRMAAVRSMIRHLKQEGVLLIFPSGHLDPDPVVLPGASESLDDWSPSIELILRKVPQAQVLITIVSGVLSRHSLKNPFIHFRKTRRDRQRIAEIYQIARQMVLGLQERITPRVNFSPPIQVSELLGYEENLLNALKSQAKGFLKSQVQLQARFPMQDYSLARY